MHVITRYSYIHNTKQYYDKHRNHEDFREGDSIWVLCGGRLHKLVEQYVGPYVIDKVINKTNVGIRNNNNQLQVVHANRLKLAYVNDWPKFE